MKTSNRRLYGLFSVITAFLLVSCAFVTWLVNPEMDILKQNLRVYCSERGYPNIVFNYEIKHFACQNADRTDGFIVPYEVLRDPESW